MDVMVMAFIVLFTLFFSAFFSGAETGLYCLNRLRLQLGADQGDPVARRLMRFVHDEQRALSVTLLGTNTMNYALTAAVAHAFASVLELGGQQAELYTVALVTPIVFVFGECVPKNLFQAHADLFMRRGSAVLTVATTLAGSVGALTALQRLARGVERLVGSLDPEPISGAPRRRVALLLREALIGDPVGEHQSEMVERVMSLSERKLHQVMESRDQVPLLSAGADRRELLSAARRTDWSRVPVFETNRRHVIGVVKVNELLRTDDWRAVADRLRPVMRLSPHDTVAKAITHLQLSKQTLAVVTNQGGQMVGVVTLKNLMEDLLGDLDAWSDPLPVGRRLSK
jgi:putative hemolysin